MANKEHLKILLQGVAAWNDWRERNPGSGGDLSNAILSKADLSWANLSKANLYKANLSGAALDNANLSGADLGEAILSKASLFMADLSGANLSGALLRGTNLPSANLSGADLSGVQINGAFLVLADLSKANLSGANLYGSNWGNTNLYRANLCDANLTEACLSEVNFRMAYLIGANLSGADLGMAQLIETDLRNATLTGSYVYGVSVWNINVDERTKQQDLIITRRDEPVITVDNIKVAQFIYLLLNNQEIRDVIDTITSKVILILGRFTEERKAVLDAIRDELRNRNFTPVVFDFDKPASKDVTGTVETLARMARFIIADLTDPSSIPHELATVVPFLRTTPVLPIRLEGSGGYSMFDDLSSYAWVLKQHKYKDSESLISALPEVIAPADKMAEKFRKQRPPLTKRRKTVR